MIEVRIAIDDTGRWRRKLLVFVVGCIFFWLAYQVRDIWLPLLISLLIAMVLDPLVDRMESRGWSRLKGALLIYVAFFIFIGAILTLALPPLVNQTTTITNSISGMLPSDLETNNQHQVRLRLRTIMKRLHAEQWVENAVVRASAQISQGINSATAWLGRVAQAALSNLLWVAIIPLVSFYALKDLHLIYARLLLLVPREHRAYTQDVINKISVIFVRYLRGLLVVCALNGVATALVLTLFGVPNAFGLGGISGVLYSVPYLGPAITILLIGGVSMMAHKAALLIVIAMIVLHNLIFDQILTPRILGLHVGLHPILSIVALLAGGSLLGILGMILAVPLAATVQMIVMTVFPKLAAPIEVPTGEQLHHVDASSSPDPDDDALKQTLEVHQTIVEAVDTAEENERSAEEETTQSQEIPAERGGDHTLRPASL